MNGTGNELEVTTMNEITTTLVPAVEQLSDPEAHLDTLVRLYCGRSVPEGRTTVNGSHYVYDGDVEEFVEVCVSREFPEGWTRQDVRGGWRDETSGRTIHENSVVFEFCVNWGRDAVRVMRVARAWKGWFRQDAVMLTRQALDAVDFV